METGFNLTGNNLNIGLPNTGGFLTYFNDENVAGSIQRAMELDWDIYGETGHAVAPPYPNYQPPNIEDLPKEVIQEIINALWEYLMDIEGNLDRDGGLETIEIDLSQKILDLTKPYWKIK